MKRCTGRFAYLEVIPVDGASCTGVNTAIGTMRVEVGVGGEPRCNRCVSDDEFYEFPW
jgi:hypothetical protein